jgi:hypothetical protein
MPPTVIPMLPCADIDEIAEFMTALGFTVTYQQTRPNPFVAFEGHGFPIQYYGLDGHRAEQSHSTCGVLVADTQGRRASRRPVRSCRLRGSGVPCGAGRADLAAGRFLGSFSRAVPRRRGAP